MTNAEISLPPSIVAPCPLKTPCPCQKLLEGEGRGITGRHGEGIGGYIIAYTQHHQEEGGIRFQDVITSSRISSE